MSKHYMISGPITMEYIEDTGKVLITNTESNTAEEFDIGNSVVPVGAGEEAIIVLFAGVLAMYVGQVLLDDQSAVINLVKQRSQGKVGSNGTFH